MASSTSTRDRLLNVALVGLALLLAVLAYSLLTRVLRPGDGALGPGAPTAAADTLDIPNVEVFNTTGESGLAARARRYLMDHGVDVVTTGNASGQGGPSRVVSRTGDLAPARRVARILGIRETRVTSDPVADLTVDATVLLGDDYATLLPFAPDSTR